jgi:[acyl-carrier-protein] S-malonyltransferase
MREVKVAFVAPGQGVEKWESGLRLLDESPRTAEIYETVHDATGVNIVDVCNSTMPVIDPAIVQPAALGIGVAQAEVYRDRGIEPDYVIGISSGEFTVSAITGALSLKDAAYISQQRGLYQMEAAGGLGGSVTALHKRPLDLKSLLNDLEGAWPANFHAPDVTNFGYLMESKEKLVERLGAQGARLREVNVPFPPHGDVLRNAQERVALLLSPRRTVKKANTKIISIRTAKPMRRARAIRHNLIWQTTEPTQFNKAVLMALKKGVEDFYDLGPDDICTKLLGRIIIDPNIRINPVPG